MERGIYTTYLNKAYGAYSRINTMVTNDNKRLLTEIYVPLTLVKEHQNGRPKKVKIEGLPREFEHEGKRILIVDRAGMGKSTLVKRIFIDIYDNHTRIPLFVELRRISNDQTVLNYIQEMVGAGVDATNTLLHDLELGNFVLFLDGFDEVQMEFRDKMKSDIMSFVSKYGRNIFIVTSRPEDDFEKFANFERYTIARLERDESYDLLKKHDKYHDLSESLIKKLNLDENKSVLEYLQTPLLVSLLYAAFNFKHTIPLKKHLFYEQVFEAFFERHDLTKEVGYVHEKKSRLDIYDFERVLRLLGLKSLTSQKVEFQKTELTMMVDESKRFLPDLIFLSPDFVDDLLHSVPLFCKDGSFLKWVHKSMQEYFAARFIYMDAKSEQDKMLTAVLNSKKLRSYYNMLDIYYDIDNYGFQKNILLPLLKEYVAFYKANFHFIEGISENLVKERIGLLFLRKAAIDYNINRDEIGNVFDGMAKWCRQQGFDVINMHVYEIESRQFCTANNIDPKLRILSMIRHKRPDLFVLFKHSNFNHVPEGVLSKDRQIISGVDDFMENEELYRFCNFCLRHICDVDNIYFDYDKVVEEIGRIESDIVSKEKTSLLISGL